MARGKLIREENMVENLVSDSLYRHRRKNRKILRYNFLKYFVKSFVECTLHLKIEVLLIFHFQM
jgi:hypothetical protein